MSNSLLTASNTLIEVQEQFKRIAPELENLGRTSFGDSEVSYMVSSHPEIIVTIEKISETKTKLSEAEDAGLKRQEEAKKGFWSQIKSSVGNLFNMIDTYRQQLAENYINLAKLIIVYDEQSEKLDPLYSENIVSEVRRLY